MSFGGRPRLGCLPRSSELPNQVGTPHPGGGRKERCGRCAERSRRVLGSGGWSRPPCEPGSWSRTLRWLWPFLSRGQHWFAQAGQPGTTGRGPAVTTGAYRPDRAPAGDLRFHGCEPRIASPLCCWCQVVVWVFFETGFGGVPVVVPGRRLVPGPGVACPKSWRAGCEPAALDAGVVPRARPRRCGGIGGAHGPGGGGPAGGRACGRVRVAGCQPGCLVVRSSSGRGRGLYRRRARSVVPGPDLRGAWRVVGEVSPQGWPAWGSGPAMRWRR